MYALFFMSDTMTPDGVEDCTVLLFDTEEQAIDQAYEILLAASLIREDCDKAAAVAAAQDRLSPLEFCHVYSVDDRRAGN